MPCAYVYALSFASLLTRDGHEVETLPEVRSADPRSAGICRPDGVARSFQVRANKVEPPETVRTRNLLSKDDWRAALLDEREPGGPEVPIVGEAFRSPRLRERLTGAGACPYGARIVPASESQRVQPLCGMKR